jgi:hypothetical protein
MPLLHATQQLPLLAVRDPSASEQDKLRLNPLGRTHLMGDLTAWLGAVHKTCVALLGPLDDEYGIDEVEGLLDLEPQHIDKLCDLLKLSPGKKFRRALEALAIDAALPGDAAGMGPKSIPEAVPPEKPIDLHTVGTLSPASEPESVGGEPFFSDRIDVDRDR